MSGASPRCLLAVESATRCASVALVEGAAVRAEAMDDTGRDQSETLLPLVERVLAQAGVLLDDLTGFALSIGPGSFTSLRIGLATVKGLAMPDDLPVAAISTLEALAWQWGGDRPETPVAALLDARRGELYAAAFGRGREPILAEGLYTSGDLRAQLPEACVLVGDGASLLAADGARPGWRIEGGPPLAAASVGILGVRAFDAGEVSPASLLVPRYVRRAEAEAKRLGRASEPRAPGARTAGTLDT